jgi:poly(3-hydroxybutyrate) depolymerase
LQGPHVEGEQTYTVPVDYTDHEGNVFTEMEYTLLVPSSYDESRKVPLVFAMHGSMGNGPDYAAQHAAHAADLGFIIVAPTSFRSSFDASGHPPPPEEPAIIEIIEEVDACYNTDPGRRYMFGFSAGGFFSGWFCLAHESLMTACGVFGGGGNQASQQVNDEPHRTPFFLWTGQDDALIGAAQALADALEAAGYDYVFETPAGVGHQSPPGEVWLRMWDWWQSRPPLPG